MDVFVEQLVLVKKGAREWAMTVMTVLSSLFILTFVCIFLLPALALVAACVGLGGWYLITAQTREFEYSVTNGTIDVDIIVAKRRRQRMVSVSGGRLETFTPYTPAIGAQTFDRRVLAWTSPKEPGAWAFTYHSKKGGHTLVVFHPNDKVLEAVHAGLPPLMRREMEKAWRGADN